MGDHACNQLLTLPLYASLTTDEMDYVRMCQGLRGKCGLMNK